MKSDSEILMDAYLPLRDVVFSTLRKAILRGELKPGERLMEVQLANKLGVSRTPIREAIRKLELEGLVLVTPRKGAEVAEITEKSLRDALEVRRDLEKLAVSLACERITKEDICKLRDALDNFVVSLESNDVTEMAKADESFHNILYNAADNKKLIQILHSLLDQVYRYRVEYLKQKNAPTQIIREHEEIVNAVEKGDKERASEVAAIHIENQFISVAEMIRKE